jgi:hypothetical protein
MLATLRGLLATLGVAAVLICLSILVIGAQATAWSAERAYGVLTHWRGPAGEPWPATTDSELRFYAPFWGAFGLMALEVARRPLQRLAWTPWLAAVFFAGGLGRLISLVAVGTPHPFFVLLMAIELLLPPVLVILWLVVRSRPD